jgi:hypothetical protein
LYIQLNNTLESIIVLARDPIISSQFNLINISDSNEVKLDSLNSIQNSNNRLYFHKANHKELTIKDISGITETNDSRLVSLTEERYDNNSL